MQICIEQEHNRLFGIAMKKTFFLIVGLSLIMSGMSQQQVSLGEAIHVANLKAEANKTTIRRTYTKNDSLGNPLLYEILLENNMTILVSGNKQCPPILAEFQNGTGMSALNNQDVFPSGFNILMEQYEKNIERCYKVPVSSLRTHQEWDSLLSRNAANYLARNRSEIILMSSQWGDKYSNDSIDNQAYNYYAPTVNGCKCPVGCAAVAMGQIMNYWNYPMFLIADSVIFDWCNMGDDILVTQPCYQTRKEAIGKLLKVCGDAANTVYSCNHSSATKANVKNALSNTFYYHTSSGFTLVPSAPDPNNPELQPFFDLFWDDVNDNINDGRPILCRGIASDNTSHYFVCDGKSSYFRLHFNWGMNGQGDGFFNVLSDLPMGYDFTLNVEMLMNIYPNINITANSDTIKLTDFYSQNLNSAGNIPIYGFVPSTGQVLISASASSSSSWRTIPSGESSIYQAHGEIILQDGFTAENGCDFIARISPCINCHEEDMVYATSPSANTTSIIDLPSPTDIPDAKNIIFPNPTDGELTMNVEGTVESIVIYNLQGQPVGGWHMLAVSDGNVTIDVRPLRSGTYLLCVRTTDGKVTTGRFVRK